LSLLVLLVVVPMFFQRVGGGAMQATHTRKISQNVFSALRKIYPQFTAMHIGIQHSTCMVAHVSNAVNC
jgi:hypothetical protein